MLRQGILGIRRYNTFRLQSLSVARKRPAVHTHHEVDHESSDTHKAQEELDSIWNGLSRMIYTRNLTMYNCFVLFQYCGKSADGSLDESDVSRLYHTLRRNYRTSNVIYTGSFNQSVFNNCFKDAILPENTNDSLLLSQFLQVQQPSVISKIMSIAEKRHYTPSVVGVKVSQKSSLIPLKELKPLLQEFSTMYEDFTYDNLMKIAAASKHKTNHGKLRYLLKTFAKFGITEPKITQDTTDSNDTWFILSK
ncbi:uncharacterized protein KLLA0_B14190g [Kluyveromyces lactis]|uniref:KLLA0B14190p n=1 Tax=Kluyveromyces lactis (strain ATCC 8585 / CBS 2359 / DSM 70799 / NBRC 1267 / NRRL Y-1140 / WM37) TaxID=284590 RepID=Q6CV76_KLULA|nr:uncharacterized protein KLLA0_B14190g [Kluyveromyces lactis]CAH02556.1 KLLA0B14190p [Kluyveromyces lactis]|eukprot:XP_452163.1 uncharacterized protein KLLA0_B14190g [Kluyveromyces lactis]